LRGGEKLDKKAPGGSKKKGGRLPRGETVEGKGEKKGGVISGRERVEPFTRRECANTGGCRVGGEECVPPLNLPLKRGEGVSARGGSHGQKKRGGG